MNLEMKIQRAIALESDAMYEAAEGFGRRAAASLKEKRAQITGLESIANGTQKASDVFDYLKLRTARQKEWRQDNLGADLLGYLEMQLEKRRKAICTDLTNAGLDLDDYRRQEVYLRLIRAFVAQVAAQYEYACQGTGA